MRIRDSPEQQAYIKSASDNRQLGSVFAALDFLGQTPWAVNRKIFDVITAVWNSGEAVAQIPVKNPLMNMPDPVKPENADSDEYARAMWRTEMRENVVNKRSAHSERCLVNYKLEVARAVSRIAMIVCRWLNNWS